MIFAVFTVLALVTVSTEQARPAQRTNAKPSEALTHLRQAVEDHFRTLEETTTVRLRDVSITPSKGGATLAVEITAPSDQKFEFHAETSYMHIGQALVKERSSFNEISTVRVSLVRPARRMTIQMSDQECGGFLRLYGLRKIEATLRSPLSSIRHKFDSAKRG